MSYRLDSANDPNEAYAVIPMPAKPHCPPTGRWTVTRNGVPVWFFPPNRHDLAERFATDPAYRLELVSKNYQLRREQELSAQAREQEEGA